jgi:hypothetical protein
VSSQLSIRFVKRNHALVIFRLRGKSAPNQTMQPTHVYEVRPRKDKRGMDLISDVLPFGRLWYGKPDAVSNAIGYAKFYSRSHVL